MVNLLEHLLEQGVVQQEGDRWTLRDPQTAATSLPDALQLLITKRLEMLDREAQRVLEVASVAGDVFATVAVAAGLDMAVDEVDALCARLAQQHVFLEPAGLAEGPDGTLSGCYRFAHTLYRQVLAARLGALQRVRVQHRLAAHLGQGVAVPLLLLAPQLAFQFGPEQLPQWAVPSLYEVG
jgi:predicted ATPase